MKELFYDSKQRQYLLRKLFFPFGNLNLNTKTKKLKVIMKDRKEAIQFHGILLCRNDMVHTVTHAETIHSADILLLVHMMVHKIKLLDEIRT